MEDKYYLADVLESLKNMTVNMAIALNEASNESLYKKFFKMFEKISEEAKVLFAIAYLNNWYSLEEATVTKIDQSITKLEKELENSWK